MSQKLNESNLKADGNVGEIYIYMERRERESRFLILSPFSITKMMIKVYD